MTMDNILRVVLNGSLIIHTLMLVVVVWRIWRGKTIVDRLIGVELMTTLLMAILVLLGLFYLVNPVDPQEGQLIDKFYLDIAIGLAALGFVTSIALAKYLADEQLF